MAKREECAFCTKFRQGAYGPKCSYFGKQPVFDGTPCSHNVGMPPKTEEKSSTKNNQRDVKDEIKEKNFKRETYNLFEDLPWWLEGGLGGGALLVIGRIIFKFIRDHKDNTETLYAGLLLTLIVLMVVGIVASIYLFVAFGRLKTSTQKHRVLFPLFKSPKLNVISLLFWMQLGLVVTNGLSLVGLFDIEWPLVDVLSDCFWFLVASVAILAGIRFNGFEKEHTGFNDQFGAWLIGYGAFSLLFFAVNILVNNYLDEFTMVPTVLLAVMLLINIVLDAIYAYNIIRYSKQNVPVLFEIYEFNNPDAAVKTQETTNFSQPRPYAPVPPDSQQYEASADTKICPYCGEWLEK